MFSQKDPRWANQRLGTCNGWTIGTGGCFVTCLAMFSNKTPAEVDELLTRQGGYSQGCMMLSKRAAELLGIDYHGRSQTDPGTLCVAETDHYKSQGVPQHFFVYKNGMKVDPLHKTPRWINNNYNIVSYRLFDPVWTDQTPIPEFTISGDAVETLEKGFDKDLGNKFSNTEAEDIVKDYERIVNDYEEITKFAAKLSEQNDELKNEIDRLKKDAKQTQGIKDECDELMDSELKKLQKRIRKLEKENRVLIEKNAKMSWRSIIRIIIAKL